MAKPGVALKRSAGSRCASPNSLTCRLTYVMASSATTFAMKIFFSGNSFGWILDQVLGHQDSEEDDHGNPDRDGPYRRQVRRSSAISTSRGEREGSQAVRRRRSYTGARSNAAGRTDFCSSWSIVHWRGFLSGRHRMIVVPWRNRPAVKWS